MTARSFCIFCHRHFCHYCSIAARTRPHWFAGDRRQYHRPDLAVLDRCDCIGRAGLAWLPADTSDAEVHFDLYQ
jgi:hypothetical protein